MEKLTDDEYGMLCPLTLITTSSVSDCQGIHCGWWAGNMCAVATVAMALDMLAAELERRELVGGRDATDNG